MEHELAGDEQRPLQREDRARAGFVDIEFLTQMLQLRYGATVPSVRKRATRHALTALAMAGLVPPDDAATLLESTRFWRTLTNRFAHRARPARRGARARGRAAARARATARLPRDECGGGTASRQRLRAPHRPRARALHALVRRGVKLTSRNTSDTSKRVQKSDVIWFDGAFVPWEKAQVHVLTHTLHYGLGRLRRHSLLRDERRAVGRLSSPRPHPPALRVGADPEHHDPVRRAGDRRRVSRVDSPQHAARVLHPAARLPRRGRDGLARDDESGARRDRRPGRGARTSATRACGTASA